MRAMRPNRRANRRRHRVLAGRESAEVLGESAMIRSRADRRCSSRRIQSAGSAMGAAACPTGIACAARIRLLRARVRHASSLYDLIRVDHVVGLYRTFNFGDGSRGAGNSSRPRTKTSSEFRARKSCAPSRRKRAPPKSSPRTSARCCRGFANPSPISASRIQGDAMGARLGRARRTFLEPRDLSGAVALRPPALHDTESLTHGGASSRYLSVKSCARARIADNVNPRAIAGRDGARRDPRGAIRGPRALVIIPIQDCSDGAPESIVPAQSTIRIGPHRLPMTLERLRRSRAIQSRSAKLREIAICTGRFNA